MQVLYSALNMPEYMLTEFWIYLMFLKYLNRNVKIYDNRKGFECVSYNA